MLHFLSFFHHCQAEDYPALQSTGIIMYEQPGSNFFLTIGFFKKTIINTTEIKTRSTNPNQTISRKLKEETSNSDHLKSGLLNHCMPKS